MSSSSMRQPLDDSYNVLQVGRNAERETIHRICRILAAKVHPDNPKAGDLDSFVLLNRAYEVLSNPETRSAYDTEYAMAGSKERAEFDNNLRDYAGLDDESNQRLILCLLYGKRRADSENPGASLLGLESSLARPREDLLFAIWYLRQKGYVRLDDRTSLAITTTGVDQVEKNLPSKTIVYKLLREAPPVDAPVNRAQTAT